MLGRRLEVLSGDLKNRWAGGFCALGAHQAGPGRLVGGGWAGHDSDDHVQSLQSCQLFVTLWTIACQAPLSMKFSGHKYSAVLCLATQSCPTVCDRKDCSPQAPVSMGILQARILEWVAMPSSRGSPEPRDRTQGSCIADRFFTVWATREAPEYSDLV